MENMGYILGRATMKTDMLDLIEEELKRAKKKKSNYTDLEVKLATIKILEIIKVRLEAEVKI